MFESSSGSFTPSPSLILSQMSDPSTMLTNICAPFLQCDIRYDSFGASLVRSLIPNIRNSLLNNDTNAFNSLPKLVKLSIDNLKEEGLNLVTDEILPELTELYLQDDSFIDLFCETISSVPARYRDDVLVDSISKNSMSNDYRLRILAASCISLVRRYNRVISHFRALAADIHPSVRITIIKSLSNCNFDEPIINSIVNDAIHDVNCEVKNSIAEVIGYIAPHLTDQYIQLLENPETQNNALLCFNVMVTSSRFSTFFDIVIKIIEKNPDKVFSAIFHAAPFIDPCEHRLLYMCAKKLRHNESFIRNLFHFTRFFSNTEKFLKFFNFFNENFEWYERILYCEQLQLFVDDFGEKILPIALNFAYDKVSAVRNQSVFVLVEIIKKIPDLKQMILSLAKGMWQQRVVLAKISLLIENDADFIQIIEKLKNDKNSRVRSQFDVEQHSA